MESPAPISLSRLGVEATRFPPTALGVGGTGHHGFRPKSERSPRGTKSQEKKLEPERPAGAAVFSDTRTSVSVFMSCWGLPPGASAGWSQSSCRPEECSSLLSPGETQSPITLIVACDLEHSGAEVKGGGGSGLRVQALSHTPPTPGKACGLQTSFPWNAPSASNQLLIVFEPAQEARNHSLPQSRRNQVHGRNSPLQVLLSRVLLTPVASVSLCLQLSG